MNGLDAHATDSPYYNAPQQPPPPQQHPHHQQQHPQQHQSPQPPKRKGEAESPIIQGQRAKRTRYISIACNECKRRKIKCNGENPCHRCGNLSLECIYAPNCCSTSFKDSEEFQSMNAQIQALQDQVNELYGQLSALRGGAPAPYQHPISQDSAAPYRNTVAPPARGAHAQYQGHTSNQYNFEVAKSSLQTMGIAEPETGDDGVGGEIDPALGSPIQHQASMASMVTQYQKDPLWQLSKDEAIRLCRVYEEEVATMYPLLDMEKTINHASLLFTFTEAAARTGLLRRDRPGMEAMKGENVNIVKMILANALMIEEYGQSELGNALYESCREEVESKLSGPVDIKDLILLVMVAEYNFQQDNEVQAYRIIGLAARLCLELGLHRRKTLFKSFPNEEDRSWAVKLFWSIIILDRRWGFGTGLPFALQDSDIDSNLPRPDQSDQSATYLAAMMGYTRIATKVWRTTTEASSGEDVDKNALNYLDFEINQWYESIDGSMKFDTIPFFMQSDGASRGKRRLQVILYMRKNQMRVHLYRPVLHSLLNIMANRDAAQTVVDVAKETITTLARLNETTDIYRTGQVVFNYFLIAALGVLFLSVAHAPNEFSSQVRDEFYLALDLVKGFSGHSYIAKRLWKTIKGLKDVAPKLGLVGRQNQLANANDPHSAAALAMAGLSGHAVDEMAAYAAAASSSSLGSSPLNGQQMTNELTNLFEAAGGSAGMGNNGRNGSEGGNGYDQVETSQGPEYSEMYGNDGEFSKLIGGLF